MKKKHRLLLALVILMVCGFMGSAGWMFFSRDFCSASEYSGGLVTLDWQSDGISLNIDDYGNYHIVQGSKSSLLPISPFIGTEYVTLSATPALYNGIVYYALDKPDTSYTIFSYDTERGTTKELYHSEDISGEVIFYGFSFQGKDMILIENHKLLFIHLATGLCYGKLDYPNTSQISLEGAYFYRLQQDGTIERMNLNSGKKEVLKDISTSNFIICHGVLFYNDLNREGKVTGYNLETGSKDQSCNEVLLHYFLKGGVCYGENVKGEKTVLIQ